MANEIDFFPADKQESFLQGDSITLGVCSQACPKYPKQHVYKMKISMKACLKLILWF